MSVSGLGLQRKIPCILRSGDSNLPDLSCNKSRVGTLLSTVNGLLASPPVLRLRFCRAGSPRNSNEESVPYPKKNHPEGLSGGAGFSGSRSRRISRRTAPVTRPVLCVYHLAGLPGSHR